MVAKRAERTGRGGVGSHGGVAQMGCNKYQIRYKTAHVNGVLPRKGGLGPPPPLMRCYCTAKVPDHNYGGCLWCQNKCIGTIVGPGGGGKGINFVWTGTPLGTPS